MAAPGLHDTAAAEVMVSLRGVGKAYRLYDHASDRLREALVRGRRSWAREFWALRDLSLEVRRGETMGVIGRNGSGKSTLLQIVTGILEPTCGEVCVRGRVAPLLELGSGFNPEFTGRENVLLNGAILGLSTSAMRERMDDILAFADIGEHVDQPVKTYSTGMFVRLAFAVAVTVDPEVLIIDEALAVGDAVFQHRCMRRIQEFRAAGKTILFVSHDSSAITTLCSRALWLHGGRERASGDPESVVKEYLAFAYAETERELAGEDPPAHAAAERAAARRSAASRRTAGAPEAVPPAGPASESPAGMAPVATATGPAHAGGGEEPRDAQEGVWGARFGNGAARILGSRILDAEGGRRQAFSANEPVTIEIVARLRRALSRPIIGFQIRDRFGTELTSTNTAYESRPLPPGDAGTVYRVRFTFLWPDLAEATYSLSPAIADGTVEAHVMCDWVDNAHVLKSRSPRHVLGVLRLSDVLVESEVTDPPGEGLPGRARGAPDGAGGPGVGHE